MFALYSLEIASYLAMTCFEVRSSQGLLEGTLRGQEKSVTPSKGRAQRPAHHASTGSA
jgi:hypothetical protein